jgi:transposase-like protein
LPKCRNGRPDRWTLSTWRSPVDAIVVKVRNGQVANRPVYAAIGVTVEGHKDVLGLWAGTGGEGAKFWMSVLVDLKNRGVCAGRVFPGVRRG